jgi:hypothetical protein
VAASHILMVTPPLMSVILHSPNGADLLAACCGAESVDRTRHRCDWAIMPFGSAREVPRSLTRWSPGTAALAAPVSVRFTIFTGGGTSDYTRRRPKRHSTSVRTREGRPIRMAGFTAQRPVAVITCGAFTRELDPGSSMTFGRGHGHPLRIGHSPEDLRVPRFAGRLECRTDGVLIHNTSDKRTLNVQTFPGPSFDIAPLMIAGTNPHQQVRVVVAGSAAVYSITIDARRLGRPEPMEAVPELLASPFTIGFDRIESISPKHRLMLAALCLPLMTRYGRDAQVPTYSEMEVIFKRYGRTYAASTIRNNLDDLRSWLTYEHRIEGLLRDSDSRSTSNDRLVANLADWAIRSGNVRDEDLDRLEDGDSVGPG